MNNYFVDGVITSSQAQLANVSLNSINTIQLRLILLYTKTRKQKITKKTKLTKNYSIFFNLDTRLLPKKMLGVIIPTIFLSLDSLQITLCKTMKTLKIILEIVCNERWYRKDL